MKHTLIGMTDFVLSEYENRNAYYYQDDKVLSKIKSYADFLKQPLNIGQFVPAVLEDGVWRVLDKPDGGMREQDDRFHKQYQEALDKVLFTGFMVMETRPNPEYSKSITDASSLFNIFWYSKITQQWMPSKGLRTIEDLIIYKPELSTNAAKTLGL